jgi:hypothetical protein
MSLPLAQLLLALVAGYAGLGVLFGVAFVARGVERLDPAARGAGWGFRLLILPASAMLWPLLLTRWVSGRAGPPEEGTAHRRAAGGGSRS